MNEIKNHKELKLSCLEFRELDIFMLYKIMKLRQEIFIVEQDCPYLDADGADIKSHHIILSMENELVAYARIVPPGISYNNYCSIGRVVRCNTYRKRGLGTELMSFAIKKAKLLYSDVSIKISAQTYITHFYKKLGFVSIGEEYLEDNIPHIAMILET
jgi:ElaA protein